MDASTLAVPERGPSLEARFRERVERCRKDHLLFAAGGAVLCLFLIVALGVFLYIGLALIGVRWLFRDDSFFRWISDPWVFGTIYVVLFLLFGYDGYRKHAQATSHDGAGEFLTGPAVWLYPIFGTGHLVIVAVFTSFPWLVFYFVKELSSGRDYFATQDVERLAYELITERGEEIPQELLREKLHSRPAALRGALQLLLQMRFARLRKAPDGIHVLRTLRWEEFLEGAGRGDTL